jgi:hypothetical protein
MACIQSGMMVSIRKFLQIIHAGLSLAHRQVGENGISNEVHMNWSLELHS